MAAMVAAFGRGLLQEAATCIRDAHAELVRNWAKEEEREQGYNFHLHEQSPPSLREQESDARASVHSESLSRFGGLGEKESSTERVSFCSRAKVMRAFTPIGSPYNLRRDRLAAFGVWRTSPA
jgi:hypothetical protein